MIQEGPKFADSWILLLRTSQHLVGEAPAGPAGDGRGKIDVAPFWMALWLAKFVPVHEKGLGNFWPVENREHRRHRDSVDSLALRNQRWIFLAGELSERVVVGKGLRKGNG